MNRSDQILVDNRVHQERAGYHVATPLRIEGSEMAGTGQPWLDFRRGYARAAAVRHAIANESHCWPPPSLPGTRFFTLAAELAGLWLAALLAEPRPRLLSVVRFPSCCSRWYSELTRIAPAALCSRMAAA